MVLELIAVYGIIIGTIVGTGHALHHMHDEPHSTSSVEVLPVLPSGGTELDTDNVPMDKLPELSEEQFISGEKILAVGGSSVDEGGFKKQTGSQDAEEMLSESSATPVSFVVPDNSVAGAGTEIKSDSGAPEVGQAKPYDIFEAVGFEENDDFENWEK